MALEHCPFPGCGQPVVVYVSSPHAYPEHSRLVKRGHGFRYRACADHEPELMNGLGDALDWSTVTRPGPPMTITAGKEVACGSRP